jgi:hypothetical protein
MAVLSVLQATLPAWVVFGLLLGLAASLLVATIFYLGDRLVPATDHGHHERGRRTTGMGRRRAEYREYLTAIDEPFVESHERAGHRLDFYLPERDVGLTFEPRVFFGLEAAATQVILCEAEMPAANLGRRLPFEIPDDVYTPPTSSDPVQRAYEQLGISPDATATEVRDAYRSRAKETHPDRGGSSEEFKQLQEAYATAKDHAEGTA